MRVHISKQIGFCQAFEQEAYPALFCGQCTQIFLPVNVVTYGGVFLGIAVQEILQCSYGQSVGFCGEMAVTVCAPVPGAVTEHSSL